MLIILYILSLPIFLKNFLKKNIEFFFTLVYNTLVKIILMFIITYEVKKVATSQDFEARRRERLKMQHKKRERQRRIQRIILLIPV